MATTTKSRPQIGDKKWQVEWCAKLAFYPNSEDVDRDRCTSAYRCFPTRDEARAFAESIFPEAVKTFGIVEVDELEYVSCGDDEYPWLCEWKMVGEHSEIFSGEWE